MKDTANLNVEMPRRLLHALEEMKLEVEATNWVDFFEKLTQNELHVYFELISVDGEPSKGHTIIFKLGNVLYRCVDGDSNIYITPKVALQLFASAMMVKP